MGKSFRFRLREETQTHHELLDRQMSALDLRTTQDYAKFLIIHILCFREIRRAFRPGSEADRRLATLLGLAVDDVAALGEKVVEVPIPTLNDIDPFAARYVIEGSRLGTQVLKLRWATEDNMAVAKAGSYLSYPASPDAWQKLCRELSLIPSDGRRAAKIVSDAKVLFLLFFDVSRSLINSSTVQDPVSQ